MEREKSLRSVCSLRSRHTLRSKARCIDTLETRYKIDTINQEALSNAYSRKGALELLSKNFTHCETTARKGLKILVNDGYMKRLLGYTLHCQGKYEEAVKVLQDYLDDAKQDDDKTNAENVLSDLKELEAAGAIPKNVQKTLPPSAPC